jgi:hypothetical protein
MKRALPFCLLLVGCAESEGATVIYVLPDGAVVEGSEPAPPSAGVDQDASARAEDAQLDASPPPPPVPTTTSTSTPPPPPPPPACTVSKSATTGKSDSCFGGWAKGVNCCAGDYLYQCPSPSPSTSQPPGLTCYSHVVQGVPYVCCSEAACTRYSTLDVKCPGQKAYYCNPDAKPPSDCSQMPGTTHPSYRCCP